jgi:tetratricopeptide (TPR) repeat protein
MDYAEALNIASQEEAALKVLDIAPTDADLAALPNEGLWLINLQAQLLGDTGKPAAALARYDQLMKLPRADRPALGGIIINHALLAQGLGQPDKTISIVQSVRGQGLLSPQGMDYLDAAVVCANMQKGQPAAADAVGNRLLATTPAADVNAAARRTALICRQRWDLAAASIIKALNDPAERMDMLFELQPFLIDDRLTARDRRERAGLRLLKARPDVKAAFLKWGRDLPAAVAPPR